MSGIMRNFEGRLLAVQRVLENIALIPQHLEVFVKLAPAIEKWVKDNPKPDPKTGMDLLGYISSALLISRAPAAIMPHLNAIHAQALKDGIIPAGTTLVQAAALARFKDRMAAYTKWPINVQVLNQRLNNVGYRARVAAKILGVAGVAGVGCSSPRNDTGVSRNRLRGGRFAAVLVFALLGASMGYSHEAADGNHGNRGHHGRFHRNFGGVCGDGIALAQEHDCKDRQSPNKQTKAREGQVEVLL